jgi:ribonuclease HI
MQSRVKIYFDGGCRPLPMGMETAVVVRGRSYFQRDLGPGTSMAAEWLALISAMEIAVQLGITNPLFLGDSLAVVRQANGLAKSKGMAIEHRLRLPALYPSTTLLPIRHVKRNQNLAGIVLARLHAR